MEWDPTQFFRDDHTPNPFALLILNQPINERAFRVLRRHGMFLCPTLYTYIYIHVYGYMYSNIVHCTFYIILPRLREKSKGDALRRRRRKPFLLDDEST